MSESESAIPPRVADLLALLAEEPALGDFALGGGTAIAFRIPYRRSVDLDFFTASNFDSLGLQDALAARLEDFAISNRTIGSLRLISGRVKAEFFHHSYPLLAPIEHRGPIRLLSLDDLAAMKVNAVTNRGSKKDFSDLLALHDHGITLERSLDLFCGKYGAKGRFLALRSLLWFEDSDGEPDPLYLNGWTWQDLRRRFEELARQLVK